PSWVFPFAESSLAPAPAAAPILEQLPYTVIGLGGYTMLADTLYLEGDLYDGLGRNILRALGTDLLRGADRLSGPAYYWRAVLQHEFNDGEHYVALGTYGVYTETYPNRIQTVGKDSYTDIAFDATYQWIAHPERSTSDMLSAHALYIHEDSRLTAS